MSEQILAQAEIALAKGDAAGAERCLSQAWPDIARAPGEAQHLMGMIRVLQQRLDDAETLLRGAIRAEPNSLRHHIALGHLLMAAGKAADAADAYQAAGRIDAKWPGLLLVFSQAAYKAGRAEEAEHAARQLLAETPSADAWDALASALRAQGRAQDSLAAAETALGIDRFHTGAANSKGAAFLMLNRGAEALAIFDALTERGVHEPVLSLNRGAALQLLGRKDDARAVYDEAAKRWPELPNLKQQLAQRR